MAEDLAHMEPTVKAKVSAICERRIHNLIKLWEETYEADICDICVDDMEENCQLPTDSDMKEFRAYLDRMQKEKANRIEFLEATQQKLQSYFSLIGIIPETEEHQKLAYGDVKPTNLNIRNMRLLENKLIAQYDDMKADIDSTRGKLVRLWEFLKVPKSKQMRYERYTEYNSVTQLKLFEELQRLEAIKRENMQECIGQLRREILIFWDKTYKSQEERDRFVHFNIDIYNEDQLELHEMELADLKNFYTQNEEVFKAYEDRAALWEKLQELDAKANNPGRLKNRGGKLLQEEKERKALEHRLPKVEAQLKEKCDAYEEKYRKPCTINGKRVEDIITEDYDRRAEEKQAARKHPPSTGNTPLYRSRTPSPSPSLFTSRTPSPSPVHITHTVLTSHAAKLTKASPISSKDACCQAQSLVADEQHSFEANSQS